MTIDRLSIDIEEVMAMAGESLQWMGWRHNGSDHLLVPLFGGNRRAGAG